MRPSTLLSRLLAASLLVASASVLPGCRGKHTRPPYSLNAEPEPADLLAAAQPSLDGIRVSSAKIRLNRSIAGNLMLLAQRPERFNGQIQISGKELVSLAFHEQGYSLRYVSGEGLPRGFYSGPPSACAIEELLGVSMAPRELIALVLGGAPLLTGPLEIVDQHWDRQTAHEVLQMRSGNLKEELRFAWIKGNWWPAGMTLWRQAEDGTMQWMWTALHESPHTVDGHTLPSKTVITRPDRRRKQRVTITYRSQEPNPAFMHTPDAGTHTSDDGGWDSSDEWESDDDAEWESDDDAEWESDETSDGAPAAKPGDPVALGDSDGAAGTTAATTTTTPASPATQAPPATDPMTGNTAPKPVIPPHFILNSDGLPSRGDLCRQG
ncbi:MAG TPA: hypothetical protein ENJ18_15120 [Nannocystis exedens]|nr:hypothetical protein [Nannocystis exedens]